MGLYNAANPPVVAAVSGTGATYVYKTQPTTRTTTTFAADPDLAYTITATGTYLFQITTSCSATAGGAGSIAAYMSFSGTSNTSVYTAQFSNNQALMQPFQAQFTNTTGITSTVLASSSGGLYNATGFLLATSNGSLAMWWNSPGGVSMALNAGSMMSVAKVA